MTVPVLPRASPTAFQSGGAATAGTAHARKASATIKAGLKDMRFLLCSSPGRSPGVPTKPPSPGEATSASRPAKLGGDHKGATDIAKAYGDGWNIQMAGACSLPSGTATNSSFNSGSKRPVRAPGAV